ncbi:MAG: hypothetical protein DHS20C05_25060 [Hyphococcus sp.]|nr:MAG: hypothetical protein DHS20C05_25060 [Marinicaulis sp.]
MSQNTSHAVMSQRTEAKHSLDNFPTPPWATRALIEHVIGAGSVKGKSCLEPACGSGHMAAPLSEYFGAVHGSDIYDYGYGDVCDFLTYPYEANDYDWVITNPPFRSAEEFTQRALTIAKDGVAILARTLFIESVGRYQKLFKETPPTIFAQFTERVPMVKGRLDRKASTATGYAWLVWQKSALKAGSRLNWIPPCRKDLERDRDYSDPITIRADYTSQARLLAAE